MTAGNFTVNMKEGSIGKVDSFTILFCFLYHFLVLITCTVDSRYVDFGYLEQPLISKKKSGPCFNIEI